jgi:hypothetical protein
MFNFKEGPKRKMLKVQYFKHPNIARHLYNRFLAAYGKLSWNDEVPHYFDRLFYAYFFMGMHPDYTNLPSSYYGVGKGRTYDQKGAYQMKHCRGLHDLWYLIQQGNFPHIHRCKLHQMLERRLGMQSEKI